MMRKMSSLAQAANVLKFELLRMPTSLLLT